MSFLFGTPKLNYTHKLCDSIPIPGPRISPCHLDIKNMQANESNVLFLEYERSIQIYEQIVNLANKGYIKQGHSLSSLNLNEEGDTLEQK